MLRLVMNLSDWFLVRNCESLASTRANEKENNYKMALFLLVYTLKICFQYLSLSYVSRSPNKYPFLRNNKSLLYFAFLYDLIFLLPDVLKIISSGIKQTTINQSLYHLAIILVSILFYLTNRSSFNLYWIFIVSIFVRQSPMTILTFLF